jgi:hypothetical protein
VAKDRITREDAESALAARIELGRELEPELADAFADRIERAIDARVEQRVAAARRAKYEDSIDGSRLALAIVSLGTGIPITAIAAEQGGVAGIVVAWLGIVGVNAASGFKRS